jgi:hypothetical protein
MSQVRAELEQAIDNAGGVNALARAFEISTEPLVRARKPDGQIRPKVLRILGLRKREDTYERIGRTR